ncbi:MAG TPA: hypothetical protein IAC57_04135 [Candidatus Scatosoma pullistercoris]|uniref:Uncharacterized protein n=1 Tax=Candidatus Scatosoma pullistercoris TaxID=2840934 RepID=A0A9D1MF66_9FIRM|nr:hypothetical protein [Candidatus Scatosoma pullistercoris]
MSNTSTNYAELNVTNDDMKEMLAEGSSQPAAEKTAPAKKKKNVGYRILALILMIAPIVCFCLVKLNVIISTTAGYAVYSGSTLLDAFLALFKTDGLKEFYEKAAGTVTGAASAGFDTYKIFGIPVLSGAGSVGKVMGLLLYAMPAAIVVTLVMALIAVFSGKAAPAMARAIAFVNFWVYGVYALCLLTVTLYYANLETTFDIVALAIAGACFLIYLVLSFIKAGKHTWMTLLLFLLTAAFAGAMIYGTVAAAEGIAALLANAEDSLISGVTKGDFYRYAIIAALGVSVLAVVVSSMRLCTKKGYGFDLFRYIVHFLVAGALLYFVFAEGDLKDMQLYVIIAAAIALVQIILVCIVISAKKAAKKKAVKEKVSETTEAVAEQPAEEKVTAETTETTETEEPEQTGVYVEAVRYDVNTQEPAREAEPLTAAEATQAPVYNYNFTTQTEAQPAGPAATADYDFYNSRSFDPFIASLNATEREQFTEIFILKYKGETKNLPDYQVGGDNTEFFRKVFIYLGQYRDRIPDSLLGKMYQFAIRK